VNPLGHTANYQAPVLNVRLPVPGRPMLRVAYVPAERPMLAAEIALCHPKSPSAIIPHRLKADTRRLGLGLGRHDHPDLLGRSISPGSAVRLRNFANGPGHQWVDRSESLTFKPLPDGRPHSDLGGGPHHLVEVVFKVANSKRHYAAFAIILNPLKNIEARPDCPVLSPSWDFQAVQLTAAAESAYKAD